MKRRTEIGARIWTAEALLLLLLFGTDVTGETTCYSGWRRAGAKSELSLRHCASSHCIVVVNKERHLLFDCDNNRLCNNGSDVDRNIGRYAQKEVTQFWCCKNAKAKQRPTWNRPCNDPQVWPAGHDLILVVPANNQSPQTGTTSEHLAGACYDETGCLYGLTISSAGTTTLDYGIHEMPFCNLTPTEGRRTNGSYYDPYRCCLFANNDCSKGFWKTAIPQNNQQLQQTLKEVKEANKSYCCDNGEISKKTASNNSYRTKIHDELRRLRRRRSDGGIESDSPNGRPYNMPLNWMYDVSWWIWLLIGPLVMFLATAGCFAPVVLSEKRRQRLHKARTETAERELARLKADLASFSDRRSIASKQPHHVSLPTESLTPVSTSSSRSD